MYDNVMIHLSQEEAEKKIAQLKDNSNVFTVVLDGAKIPDWRNYIRIVEKEYRFPTKNDNFDGYYDWMCDLSWLGENEGYALFIFNFEKFPARDPYSKNIVLEIFYNLLGWWSVETERCAERGSSRPFNVYLID